MAFEPTPSWALNVDWTGAATRRHASAERFVLEVPIGVGGTGEVWRAHDPVSDRAVAIKVLAADVARHPELQAELRREVRMAAGLRHPSVVRILDVGSLGPEAERATSGRLVAGSPFVAMELMRGGTLHGFAASNEAELVTLADALLRGLSHSHARGVLHLDLKPANVLRDGERFVLADFGIAQRIGDHAEAPGGSPAYRAPEQRIGDGRRLGPRTDLFALGLVLWELTTGSLPYEDLAAARMLFARPPPLRPRFPVGDWLARWLQKMVECAPDARFTNAAVARAELVGEPLQLPPRWPVANVSPLEFGAGLWALAEPPFVGRAAERERLWSIAHEVAAGAAREIRLAGPEGVGKRRLAEELSSSLVETGVFERCRAESKDELEAALLETSRPCVAWIDGCEDVRPSHGVLMLRTGGRGLELAYFGDPEREALFDALRLDVDARRMLERVPAPGPLLMEVAAHAHRGGWVRSGDSLAPAAARPSDAVSASVDALASRLSEPEVRALEVAAVLGETERSIWREASRRLRLAPSWIALDRAVAEGLARLVRDRVVLRTDVAAYLRRRGRSRLDAIHRACLAALESAPRARRRDERLAQHAEHLGELELAARRWLAAADERIRALDVEGARGALRRFDALGREGAELLVRRALVLARIARRGGDLGDALEAAKRAHRAARELGDDTLLAEAAHLRGRTLRASGDPGRALSLYLQSSRAAERAGREDLLADAMIDRASVLTATGAYDAGREALAKARSVHPDPRARAWCDVLYGRALRRAGLLSESEGVLVAARTTLLEHRRGLVPEADLELGHVHAGSGRLAAAEASFSAALEGFVALGSDRAIAAERALGLLLVEKGDAERAHAHLLGSHRALEAQDAEAARSWRLAFAWLFLRAGDEDAAIRELEACTFSDDPEWSALRAAFERDASGQLHLLLARLVPAT